MDAKESERCFHGYVFVPYCAESCCQNHPQSLQPYPDNYPSSISKYDAISVEQSRSDEAHLSRFNSNRDAGLQYRLLSFPAIQRELHQPYKISRHNIGAESQLASTLKENYFYEQKDWKLEAGCRKKRNRTIFTADQLDRLEKEFDRQQYIVGAQRFYLAAELGLNETQVKVWFQNRRIKWRRQHLESTCNVEKNGFERDDD